MSALLAGIRRGARVGVHNIDDVLQGKKKTFFR